MDLFSRKIIAWTLSETLEAEHVANTVRKAMRQRNVTAPLVMHSDRGSQYVSAAYLEAATDLTLSYSKKGYPYDNACIESFHSLIKREWLNRFKIRDYDHAGKLVFEYIDAFYNTVRIHSHCDFCSPNDFENMYNFFPSFRLQFCRVIQSFAFWSVYFVFFIDIRAIFC